MRFLGMYLTILALFALSAMAHAEEKVLTVFAAASLNESLTQAAKIFEVENGVTVSFSFGASGTLARQIAEGAPAQVFISAATKWTKELKTKGMLENDQIFLLNELVLIADKKTDLKVEFIPGFDFAGAMKGKLSIGEPESVPAGKYAQEALKKLGWWDGVKNRLVQSKDVRETMRVVEMGGADFGIVYKTDALLSKEIKILGTFPAESHTPVTYGSGVVKGGGAMAHRFIAFLATEKAAAVFTKHGFKLPAK